MFLLRDINPLSLKLLKRIYRESRHHQVRLASTFSDFSFTKYQK